MRSKIKKTIRKRSKNNSKRRSYKKGGGKNARSVKKVNEEKSRTMRKEKVKEVESEKKEKQVKQARFGLGVFGFRMETKEEKIIKMRNKILNAQKDLNKILNGSLFKYEFVDVLNPNEFLEFSRVPFIGYDDKTDKVVIRQVVVVDLEKIPYYFKGDFSTLTYENELGEKITKQAFYKSSGVNSSMRDMWFPFDGISYSVKDGVLNTRFEKDNFITRFGGITEKSNSEEKLAIVSQILGGPLWNIREDIYELINNRLQHLRNSLESVEEIITEDDMNKINKLNKFLDGITNIWENYEDDRDEVPNILNYYDVDDNLVYHNESSLKLSNGIIFPEVNEDIDIPTDVERMENAKRINLLIRDSNSLKVDFSKFENNVPSWEQLLDVLSKKGKNNTNLRLFYELKSRLV